MGEKVGFDYNHLTEDYLEIKYPMIELDDNIMINASFLPTDELVVLVKGLKQNQIVFKEDVIVAFFATSSQETKNFDDYEQILFSEDLIQIKNTWDIFTFNDIAIQQDFDFLTKGRKSAKIPDSVHCFNKENIFVEEGAELSLASLNATDGPIYIGENSLVMEGCAIRGPFALCHNSALKMGTKIYGATTVGPHSTVGGEVKNVVIFGYSNKGHEGYLGNSVIGEWCNLGADTNSSNLKNNYSKVRLWSYETERFAKTGLQFCGLMMGDHSKCGINTMFNTGTVVGVSANVFGAGFQRNFIPSFALGGTGGFKTFQLKQVKDVASAVMSRKNIEYDAVEEQILTHVFDESKKYRNFQ